MARRRLTITVVLAAAVMAAACTRDGEGSPSTTTTTAADTTSTLDPDEDAPAVEDPIGSFPRGGTVRVAVWGEPDPTAATLGGAAVRALVLPQLFFAKPDGRWGPLIVEPGSDRAATDRRSATFKIRPGAAWSDGAQITADDLRRTADARYVAAVDGPADDGTITLRFTQPLPGWRRLWSGTESIAAPKDGVWGGPFVVASRTPGLETVLRRNPGWKGQGPFLDEVRLVLVPDSTMARQLLHRDAVDVVAPLADTQRTAKLGRIPGVTLHSTVADGGWWVGLFLNRDRLGPDERRAAIATIDRTRFPATLLDAEAVRLDGFGGVQDTTWAGVGWGAPGAAEDVMRMQGDTIDLVGEVEDPLTPLLHRAMQKRARDVGGRFELRLAESDRVEPWLARGEYQAAIAVTYDAPVICWRCRWGWVDDQLATTADTGDLNAVAALEAKLATEAIVVPLWRPRATVAWREDAVAPLRANPFGLSAAWDAWRWRVAG